MKPASSPPDRSRVEWIAVAVVTLVGFVLRTWPVGGLGLTHFDEGIYALVASWSLLPRGLGGIDPFLIPYAPPGYPILGGLAYAVLGRSDGAMIAVSQVAGTLTIPVVAWLGRRTFGPGAGFASATFCAFSGPHIAFSRMALTDASFLLAWLIAIGAGIRFLEKPGALRAILMGLAVGLAQEFKYNGWLTGGIVVVSAIWGILVRPEARKMGSIFRTIGRGLLGGLVAWLVVWPWYRFVENHGGYSALLRHQQSYLGGVRDWWPHFVIQAEQSFALSDLRVVVPGLMIVCLTKWIAPGDHPGKFAGETRPILRVMGSIWTGLGSLPFFLAPYWLGLMMIPGLLGWRSAGIRLLGVWWLILTVMTPFYHPYARLWLPYHAVNWMLLSWLITQRSTGWFGSKVEGTKPDPARLDLLGLVPVNWISRGLLIAGFVLFLLTWRNPAFPQRVLLAPSDSLYRATVRVSEILPKEVQGLRILVRPPVTYYLTGRVPLYPASGSESLLESGDPRIWALVDSAILRSESGQDPRGGKGLDRLTKNWELVEELPTEPSLPTLLDLDPGAARANSGDPNYPLWLLRPRTVKAAR